MRLHLRHADDLVLIPLTARFPDERMRIHQLREVLIRRHHERGKTLAFRAPRQRADDVVRFITIQPQHRNAKRFYYPPHRLQALTQFLRHRLALRLVGRELHMPRRRCLSIERHRQMRRLLLLDEIQQHRGEPIERRDIHAIARHDRPLHECKMRPVNERHAVEEEESFVLCHAAPVSRPAADAQGKNEPVPGPGDAARESRPMISATPAIVQILFCQEPPAAKLPGAESIGPPGHMLRRRAVSTASFRLRWR